MGTQANDNTAGEFRTFLSATEKALTQGGDAEVPCGSCTACCTGHQFVHVQQHEQTALAAIPSELIFPAPGGRAWLMPHDESGACPMLINDRCSIYTARPQTCRSFDCRIFAAAGVYPDGLQADIGKRARAWSFIYADDGAFELHEAVRRAAKFLIKESPAFDASPPLKDNPIQTALWAIKAHHLFTASEEPSLSQIKAVLQP